MTKTRRAGFRKKRRRGGRKTVKRRSGRKTMKRRGRKRRTRVKRRGRKRSSRRRRGAGKTHHVKKDAGLKAAWVKDGVCGNIYGHSGEYSLQDCHSQVMQDDSGRGATTNPHGYSDEHFVVTGPTDAANKFYKDVNITTAPKDGFGFSISDWVGYNPKNKKGIQQFSDPMKQMDKLGYGKEMKVWSGGPLKKKNKK